MSQLRRDRRPVQGNPAGQLLRTVRPVRHRTRQPPCTRARERERTATLYGSCERASRACMPAGYAIGSLGWCFRATAVGIGLRWSVRIRSADRDIEPRTQRVAPSPWPSVRQSACMYCLWTTSLAGTCEPRWPAGPGLAKLKRLSHMALICVA